jgi:hypothetical protein
MNILKKKIYPSILIGKKSFGPIIIDGHLTKEGGLKMEDWDRIDMGQRNVGHKMRGGEDKMRRRLPILRPRGKGQRPPSREKYLRDFELEKQSQKILPFPPLNCLPWLISKDFLGAKSAMAKDRQIGQKLTRQ